MTETDGELLYDRIAQCPHCQQLFKQVVYKQAVRHRLLDYDVCPCCSAVIAVSKVVEYYNSKLGV